MKLNDTFAQRFWPKVRKTDTCWFWTASLSNGRYGQITADGAGNMIKAHRASYIMANGDIPAGMLVCHKCDNPLCVRPDHLFLGTCADNHKDRNNKGRQAKGERLGSAKLNKEQVLKIREYYRVGRYTTTQLADIFQVSNGNIHFIVSRRTWKHL